MDKHFHTLKHKVWLPFQLALGPVFLRWFEGLKKEKIWGNRCPQCRKVLAPARSFCPECNVNMDEWVEVGPEGTIVSWTKATKDSFAAPAPPPFIAALIRLDGLDCDFLHILGGFDCNDTNTVKTKVKRGARVKAVWSEKKKGHMLDIKYFQPL